MRSFTKVILMLLLCTLGVLTTQAKTEKVHATFENPSNTNTTWNAETKTFTWSTTYYNQLKNIGLPSGDITKYKKLVVDCSIKSGDQFRILFYKGGSNLTLYAKDGVNEFVLADTLKVISPNDYNEYLLACDEICLSGNNAAAPGEAVINDVYLETYDDEGEKVYATFENPSNTNTTWNAETKTFTWSTTYYNQLKNIGLPSGDISVYKKLVVDCNIKSGDQFRILIYKGGSNLTLYAKDGVNEFILADTLKVISPNDYNEYLLACDEICLSGNNAAAPGEAVINAVYLETYPENESVEIPDIVYEEDPGKPEGEFVDFTEVFSSLQPRIGLGTDGHPIVLGNGDVVVGQRTKDVIADLSAYSKLTIVTSPKMKLVLYMNHEVDAQQNAGDYAETDAGKYVFMDVQADENGIIEVDLTQFDKQDLNCICLPWDNNNKGTVWYLLLTAKPAVAEDVLPIDIQFGADYNSEKISSYAKTWTATKDGKTWTITNFNNNNNGWDLIKCGSKNDVSVASIASPAINAVVKNFVVSVSKASNVTSAKVTIYNGEDKIGDDIDITEKFVAGDVNVAVEGQKGYSYVLTIDNAQASANGSVEITKVALYGEGQYVEVEPVHIANTAETAYDVAKAVELINAGEALDETVFVKGIISKIEKVNVDAEDATKSYITYWISADGSEEGQQFECYKGLTMEGVAFEAIEVGAEVIVSGQLTKYNDIYEFKAGNQLVSYKAPVADSELMKQAKELAADAEAVAVGKLLAAIAAAEESGDESNLQAAIDQLKADNADVEKDETARVKTDGWKKFTGNEAAGLAPDWAAPAVTTYDGRTAQPAEVYEGTVATTGQIIYQDITGLTNGKYKVGFYGTAYFTNGRGFDSTMEDGSTDVAYVFANDEKSFITSRIGTSFSEYSLLQFDVEVTDGNIKLGMAKDKPGTNWHTMQIYQLTWFTTAKAAYAADQEELKTVVAEAKALLADANKTEGRELFEALVNTADEAANEKANMYNVAEIEALIGNLKTSISDFKKANYFINFTEGQYTCYVIDAESGKMMAAGHDYGTRGIVNEMGLDMTIGINTEKRMVTFETQIKNNETDHFLGSNLYMDSPAAEWGLEFQGFGFYITNGTQYINIDANDNLVMSDTPREWIIVTAEGVLEQRLSEMKEATAEKPVDATFLIQGANFNRNDQRNNAWVVSEDCTNKNLSGGNQVNNCAESFHSTFTISQVLKNAPKGIYQMTAQGFYRQDEGLEEAVPVFFIGDKTAGIPAKTGEEDSMDKASASFTEGLYTIDPIKFNFNGEELTVGVKNETATSQWIIFDNFRLSYLGEAASEDQLAALTAEIAIAKSLGVDVSAYEEGVFTAAEATAAVEALKVAEYTQVNKDYTVNAAVLIPDFAQWTGDMVSNKGQHWDGTGTSLYYEQTSAQWGQSSWTNNKKTTVTLPKGKYVLYAAGRASAGTACTAYLKVGDVTRTYTSKGDVGFGVATDGSASFDPTASYANGGKGRGFEYRYVAFEVTSEEGEEIALEIGGEATAEHQWMSFTAPVLLTTDDNIAIMIPVFKGVIETAKADLEAVKGTVGDGLFMKPQAAYNDYAAAVADAEALLGGELTADAIKAAIEAIEVKAQAFEAAPTTAPDANKTYSFELRLGGETPLYMALAEGGITIAEEATLLKFIAVEGAEGQYNLSNADGTLFVGLAGGNAWTMSTLPDQKAAWTFTALPDGAYRINNLVTAGRFVGTNAADKEAGKPCYADKQTSNGNVDWIITEVVAPHTWDFTMWSEATVANLKAEAAKGASEGLWSDWEKADGTAATMEISKDNCFWQVGTSAAEGETLTANGEEIAELKGLLFKNNKARSLAIAVNYGDCTSANGEGFGPYNGASYLWLGSKDIEYFTIKNVKAGSQIKMGVESHKPAEARGVQLLIGETVLTDPEGAEVAAPTVYTEQTWAVPAGEGVVDVVVKNTNGCHIYFIDAEIGEAPEPVIPEDPEVEVAEGWRSIISNGNLASDEVANFFIKENAGDPVPAVIVPGAGKNGSRGIVINTPDNPSADWDAQFFIQANENIPAGYKIHVEFDYKATQEAAFDTQSHAEPGDYIHWYCVDSYTATTEWQHMSKEVEVSAATKDEAGNWNGEWGKACDNSQNGKPFKTVAFNLSKVMTATTFYFDNITFWVSEVATGIETVKNAKKADVIYNLRGQKVNKAEKGLFIINGRKVVVK